MTQSVQPANGPGLVPSSNIKRSPSGQRPTLDLRPSAQNHMTMENYNNFGAHPEYLDQHGNHLAQPQSAPLPQIKMEAQQKYEPFAQAGSIEPPFRGYCENTHDALILFEAAKRGIIPRVTRRLTDREKAAMIKSGAVFVFDEHESNIKRWTDGMSWSPSRIFGNYLTYREIIDKADGMVSPNAITAMETSGSPSTASSRPFPRNPLPGSSRNRPHLSAASVSGLELPNSGNRPRSSSDSQPQPFDATRGKKGQQGAKNFWRPDGLVKRTISVLVNGYHQHLVSYYNPSDIHEDRLYRPRDIPLLAKLEIGDEYLRSDSFRLPIQTMYTADGKLRYAGEPTSVPGQPNNQNPDTFAAHPQQPLPPPASAPIQRHTMYAYPQQAYTFATVPKEAVLDPNSHSRPSTGTSHGSVITPMSPVTSGNYYDNYLEQEQQKPMTHTAPVVFHVPLPAATQQRPHTTQFGGGASMSRQMSEGSGGDRLAGRMRSHSRYQPYSSPDQANFPQTAMQLVLPGHPVRPGMMRRTPSYQSDQYSYIPMTPVSETVRNSPMSNVVVLNSAGAGSVEVPITQEVQYSSAGTTVSQGSPHEAPRVQYVTVDSNGTAAYNQMNNQQVQISNSTSGGSMSSAGLQPNRSYSHSYNSNEAPTGIASSLPNSGWHNMDLASMPSQYMGIPNVKMEYVESGTEPGDGMIPSFSRPSGGIMPAYQPSMMQLAHANGENTHAGSSADGQWIMPPGQSDSRPQQVMMSSPTYQAQPMLSMGPPQVVLSNWQPTMQPVYQERHEPQQDLYNHVPSMAQ